MNLDLFVDTSRKGIAMGIAAPSVYEEIVNGDAKGEMLTASLEELLNRVNAKLNDIKRVMVTLGPGSFSGLRTGVAFCQGLCFSGKRSLYGVTTLKALQCFAGEKRNEAAVITRARNGFWYFLLDDRESFIETADVVERLKMSNVKAAVLDDTANTCEAFKETFIELGTTITIDTGKPLSAWAPLFDSVKPSLIQEANYIQPSYFEKLK